MSTHSPDVQVLVAGAPGFAAALTATGRFSVVHSAASVSELKELVGTVLTGRTPSDLMFFFANNLVENVPAFPLRLLVQKLGTLGFKICVLRVTSDARELLNAAPEAGPLDLPCTTNTLLGAMASFGLANTSSIADAWAYEELDINNPASVQQAQQNQTVPSNWNPSEVVAPEPTATDNTGWNSVEAPAPAPTPEPDASAWASVPEPNSDWGTPPASRPEQPVTDWGSPPASRPEQPVTDWGSPPASRPEPQPETGWGQQSSAGWGSAENTYEETQRAAMPHTGKRGMVIPITVAKGGAGKSSLTLNLAVYTALRLRDEDKRVCVVDANMQQADIGNMIEVWSPNISDLANNQHHLKAPEIYSYMRSRSDLNIDFLLGPATIEEANKNWITPELYKEAIETLRPLYDYIFVDTPVAEFQHEFFERMIIPTADFMVVPVNPDWNAINSTQRWLQSVTDTSTHTANTSRISPERVGVVLNRAEEGVGCSEEDVRTSLPYRYLGPVPNSPRWLAAANAKSIIATENYPEINNAFAQILHQVTGEEGLRINEAEEQAPKKRRFFGRR